MKKLLLIIGLAVASQFTFAQSDVGGFLLSDEALNDADKLFGAYLSPYAVSLGEGLNNGWFNTAEVHKKFGFDLSISASGIMIPSADKTFNIGDLGLTTFTGVGNAPTVAGVETEGPVLSYTEGGETIEFNTPEGTGMDFIPVPMVQLGLGGIPHTDVIIRYVPKLDFGTDGDKAEIGLIGFGFKHSFKEYIPFVKRLPFDAAAFFGFTNIDSEIGGIDLTAQDIQDNYESIPTTVTYAPGDVQRLEMTVRSLKMGLIVSKKAGPLTGFFSLGYNKSKTTIGMKGDFPIITQITAVDGVTIGSIKDPIDLDLKETSNVYANLGFRLKFAFFSLFGSYNMSEYSSVNAGIGFSFR